MSVVVRGGVVQEVSGGEKQIPPDGYVINFQGQEASLAQRFKAGDRVDYSIVCADGSPLDGFWARAVEGFGAGPKLVEDGRVVYSVARARDEGFTEAKILTESGARSGLGATPDGRLLMVTVGSATVAELAQIMKEIGAHEAMNLDGGASSGLVFNGRYITRTGRRISNALLIQVGM
ncbi:MAG: phosphodiester glycosidase family protein [Clostridia bacterium]|nr:phosphodiester glycosidase family protein [Clostridia bacterium]